MPAIPLPFVVALLLAALLVRMLLDDGWRFRPVTIFVAACIVLMVTVGLRWTVDFAWVRFLQPVVASLLPPIAWLCFSGMRQATSRGRIWLHFLSPVVMVVLSAMWRQWHPPLDLLIAILYFGYGAALIRNGCGGPDQLENVRLSDVGRARQAVLTAGGLLFFSGLVDLAIFADFDIYRGTHAASIVAVANMLTLPAIAYAIAIIGRSVPESRREASQEDESSSRQTDNVASQEDNAIMEKVDAAMKARKLYRDPDLTLERIARRLGVPARQISAAINRIHGRNVSQIVNEYRVSEAKRLLLKTDLPVTSVMFESGFQTKSNFNREFARVAGTTPSRYRRSVVIDG
ncbi:AraC family transcriptional regulator [Rhizobium sp. L1K21]|uniref:helix-turn-helix domain-containing protein n=1 Tax=Rhizobium sp. L1K21 TaxID=2954933 RepID=UPI002093A3C3|nr:helix-turn-helix domain-containing protein [Rhizobium sp. L1K21]MCO6188344.1 helix-turn-helix domain-containing protein [Rhizobium sp. L1K21]